jgi:putative phage-type endonuclease
MSNIPQRSQQWFNQRKGIITSSNVWTLMGDKSLPEKAQLGDTAKTYLYENLGELLTDKVVEVSAKPLEWGTDTEPHAKDAMEKHNGVRMMECEFIIDKERIYYGGSPDGVIKLPNGRHCVEIKCPYTTAEHLKNISYCKDVETLKSRYPKLYWQIVSNAQLTTLTKALFVTFDPRITLNDKLQYNQFSFDIDPADIELLNQQLRKAWVFYQSIANSVGVNLTVMLDPTNRENARNKAHNDLQNQYFEAQKNWGKPTSPTVAIHDKMNETPVTIIDQIKP